MSNKKIVVAITGASGSIYGIRLIQTLHQLKDVQVFVLLSKMGQQVMEMEYAKGLIYLKESNLPIYLEDELTAPMASGSWLHQGMVIIPCSMATLGSIASGCGHNLIQRAADVCLKEQRKLVLVPRESPLHAIHLKNMLTLAQTGATLVPPCPYFYTQPKDVDEIIDQTIARVMDLLKVKHNLTPRWKENEFLKAKI